MKNILLKEYHYNLPDKKIAQFPLKERDTSKLLIYREGQIKQDIFKNIDQYLYNNLFLVYNNTKVVKARILFTKETGGVIEIFCIKPISPSDYSIAFNEKRRCTWECMVGNAKKWKSSSLTKTINSGNKQIRLQVNKITQNNSTFFLEFEWNNNLSFSEILELSGSTPIPPYLKREAEYSDSLRYQTVYSKNRGSVAAPTAGLHFTRQVLNKLANKNISLGEITLHVGIGTFKPVTSEEITEHIMHAEVFSVSRNLINKLIHCPERVIAVGTTSLRTLESLYWLGVKLHNNKNQDHIPQIEQWDGFQLKTEISITDALNSVIDYMDTNKLNTINTSTRLIIVPGYNFKIVNGLITNFHMSKSTLLLLIAALIGENWRKVYQYALENNFRFLSYGDSSLLFPE